jgi:hypothetical protein
VKYRKGETLKALMPKKGKAKAAEAFTQIKNYTRENDSYTVLWANGQETLVMRSQFEADLAGQPWIAEYWADKLDTRIPEPITYEHEQKAIAAAAAEKEKEKSRAAAVKAAAPGKGKSGFTAAVKGKSGATAVKATALGKSGKAAASCKGKRKVNARQPLPSFCVCIP